MLQRWNYFLQSILFAKAQNSQKAGRTEASHEIFLHSTVQLIRATKMKLLSAIYTDCKGTKVHKRQIIFRQETATDSFCRSFPKSHQAKPIPDALSPSVAVNSPDTTQFSLGANPVHGEVRCSQQHSEPTNLQMLPSNMGKHNIMYMKLFELVKHWMVHLKVTMTILWWCTLVGITGLDSPQNNGTTEVALLGCIARKIMHVILGCKNWDSLGTYM